MSNSKLARPQLAAIQIQGYTRQAFLLRSALAVSSVYGLSAVSPFVREAFGQESGGDVEILNFALTLEFLEAGFYERALKRVSGLGGEAKEIATTLRDNEQEHVDALTATIEDLGGTPTQAPGLDFGDAFGSQDSFLELAQTLEDTGVGAYNGAAPQIDSKEVLAAAGSIVQIEGRHAAAIRQLNGNPITESAFDNGLEMQEVLDAIEPFVES